MKFRRSTSGLSSMYLFHRVDAMVFVEGGKRNLSLNAINEGIFNEIAHDAKFWALLFARFLPGHRFQFRPVGSKATLQELAALVSSEQVKNVVICMGRDLDSFLGSLAKHPRIVYTHGYSWENDVWSLRSTVAVFRALSSATDDEEAVTEIRSAFARFGRTLRWPLLAHALLVTNGLLDVTTADLERAVVRGAGKMPTISSAHLRSAVKNARPKCPKPCVRFPVPARFSPVNDCYGHLLASYAFHVLAYVLRKHCNVRALGKDVASSIAISNAYATVTEDAEKLLHYQRHLSAVATAIRHDNLEAAGETV